MLQKGKDVNNVIKAAIAGGLVACALPAAAQMGAPPLSSALPDVQSISPANAAGVLQYCRSHHLVSNSLSDTVMGSLTTRPGVAKSPDYAAGQSGRIVTPGKTFSLGEASGYLQSQACDRVLRQALRLK